MLVALASAAAVLWARVAAATQSWVSAVLASSARAARACVQHALHRRAVLQATVRACSHTTWAASPCAMLRAQDCSAHKLAVLSVRMCLW